MLTLPTPQRGERTAPFWVWVLSLGEGGSEVLGSEDLGVSDILVVLGHVTVGWELSHVLCAPKLAKH